MSPSKSWGWKARGIWKIHLCPLWGWSDPRLLRNASRTEPKSHVVSLISCLSQEALYSQGFKAWTKPRELGRANTVEHFIIHLHKMSKYVHAIQGHISGSWQPMKSASVPQEKLTKPTFGIHQQKLIPRALQQGLDLQRCWEVKPCMEASPAHVFPSLPPEKHCQNQNNKTTLAKLTVIFFGWQQRPFQRFCQLMCEVSELWQSLLYFPNILSHTQIKSCLLSASPCYCTLNIRSRDSPSFGDIVLETSSPISIKFSVKMWLKNKQKEMLAGMQWFFHQLLSFLSSWPQVF